MIERADSAILFSDLMLIRAVMGLSTEARQVQKYLQATAAGTVEIFRSERGVPLGYMVWAGMVRESALRFLHQNMEPGYPYEWREGRICGVLEIYAISSQWREIGSCLRRFFRQQRAIAFVRDGHSTVYLRHARKWAQKKVATARTPLTPGSAGGAP